jgi:hypothetical protein
VQQQAQHDSLSWVLETLVQHFSQADLFAVLLLLFYCQACAVTWHSISNVHAAGCRAVSPEVIQHHCVVLGVLLKLCPDELQGQNSMR